MKLLFGVKRDRFFVRLADLIVRGLERDRSIIAFPFLFALITRLGGLLPESMQRWTTPRFIVSERAVTD